MNDFIYEFCKAIKMNHAVCKIVFLSVTNIDIQLISRLPAQVNRLVLYSTSKKFDK